MSDFIEREDAKKWLTNLREDCGRYQDLWHYAEALDQIIELLSVDVAPVRHGRWIITETPTNEYCNCSVCGTQVMSNDYIKRADALNALREHPVTKLKTAIRRLPSADVVEVVRCKDCVYYQDNNNGYPHNECRWRSDETPDAYDFCSMAERRGDD